MVRGILVPQPGTEPPPPALEAWSLNHWTTREVPHPASYTAPAAYPTAAATCPIPSTGSSPTVTILLATQVRNLEVPSLSLIPTSNQFSLIFSLLFYLI